MKDKRAVSCSACASINLELKRKLEKLFSFCVCVCVSKTWVWGRRPGCPVENAVKVCVCWCLLTGWKCYRLSQMWEAWEVIRMKQNEATSPPPPFYDTEERKEGRKEREWRGRRVRGRGGKEGGREKSETDSRWGKGGKIKTGNVKKVKGREVETLKNKNSHKELHRAWTWINTNLLISLPGWYLHLMFSLEIGFDRNTFSSSSSQEMRDCQRNSIELPFSIYTNNNNRFDTLRSLTWGRNARLSLMMRCCATW